MPSTKNRGRDISALIGIIMEDVGLDPEQATADGYHSPSELHECASDTSTNSAFRKRLRVLDSAGKLESTVVRRADGRKEKWYRATQEKK